MKKKTLGLIIAGVAAASMIGTGFAAWVITANAQETVDGQFKVDTVTEKTVTITPTLSDGTIKFLAPEGATNGWLTSDGANGSVNLTTTLNVVYGFNANASASDFQVKYDIDYSSVQAAINAGYITAPTLTLNDNAYTDATVQNLSGASEALVITFGWGAAFGGQNPYTFYNTFAYNEDYKLVEGTPTKLEDGDTAVGKIQTVAKDALTALAGINNATFTITITVTPNQA